VPVLEPPRVGLNTRLGRLIGARGFVRALVFGGLLGGGAMLIAPAESAGAAPGTSVVTIEQMRFNPPILTVRRGDRVVWVNKDLVPHTVSATSKAFESHSIAPNASWNYVARTRGNFAYGCEFHPTMHGTLIVR
jgi:plastocyanin